MNPNTHPHPYRLRPYHNPEGIDESKVPAGWRFRYADEADRPAFGSCKWTRAFDICDPVDWEESVSGGTLPNLTYIVPVDA
jgi:hypothetical protein